MTRHDGALTVAPSAINLAGQKRVQSKGSGSDAAAAIMSATGYLGALYISRDYVLAARTLALRNGAEPGSLLKMRDARAIIRDAELLPFYVRTTLDETIEDALQWVAAKPKLSSLAVAFYGPVRSTAGLLNDNGVVHSLHVGSAPKIKKPIDALIKENLTSWGLNNVIMTFHKDTAAAALGEYFYRVSERNAAIQVAEENVLAYVNFGYGIGAGFAHRGRAWEARLHPEVGHVPVKRKRNDTLRTSHCGLHNSCAIGFATISALNLRLGRAELDKLPALLNNRLLEIQAFYMAQVCSTISHVLAPQIMVLGGEISRMPGMITAVQKAFLREMDVRDDAPPDYLTHLKREGGYIQGSVITELEPGIFGALLLNWSGVAVKFD